MSFQELKGLFSVVLVPIFRHDEQSYFLKALFTLRFYDELKRLNNTFSMVPIRVLLPTFIDVF